MQPRSLAGTGTSSAVSADELQGLIPLVSCIHPLLLVPKRSLAVHFGCGWCNRERTFGATLNKLLGSDSSVKHRRGGNSLAPSLVHIKLLHRITTRTFTDKYFDISSTAFVRFVRLLEQH